MLGSSTMIGYILVAMTIIGSTVTIYHYIGGKVNKILENSEDEWCKTQAKFAVQGLKRLIEQYGDMPVTSSYDALEKYYYELYKQQLKSISTITSIKNIKWNFENCIKFFILSALLLIISNIITFTPWSQYQVWSTTSAYILLIFAIYILLDVIKRIQ